MNTESRAPEGVDPITFTKDRVVEIGEVWKSYALNKKAEAISRVEGSLDRAPAAVKRWFKRAPEQSVENVQPVPSTSANGANGPEVTSIDAQV